MKKFLLSLFAVLSFLCFPGKTFASAIESPAIKSVTSVPAQVTSEDTIIIIRDDGTIIIIGGGPIIVIP